tara:strand:+ start:2064 stop:2330 length:267 start_codon:yes stop_codon:yes gene_type:complete
MINLNGEVMPEISPEVFLTKSKFAKIVEQAVLDLRVPYMDAILEVCDEQGIEPEDVSKFISPIIKAKLEVEAQKLNYLEKTSDSIELE